MCGIVYAHDFAGRAVNNGVLDIFDKQRNRGIEGFGLFDGQENNIVRTTTEDKILDWLCKYDSHLILFHHRYPTSTDNTKNTAHPFTTKDYFGQTQYILVHNGHITNSHELKQKHEKLGISYGSTLSDGKFNDSEALLWDLALYLEGRQSELKATGGMAFVCLRKTDKLEKMYFGRNTYPLKLFRVKQGLLLSSEGMGEAIKSDTLYTYNYKLNRLTSKHLKIGAYNYPEYSVNRFSGQKYLDPPVYREDYKETELGWEKGADGTWQYDSYHDEYEEYMNEEHRQLEKEMAGEVESLALRYLIAQNGVFEIAYTELEWDYMQIAEEPVTHEEHRKMRLYEMALAYLEDDPEWTDMDSVSSLSFENPQLIKETS